MREDEISGGAPEDAHYILKQSYPLTNETLITALDEKIKLVGAGAKCLIEFQQGALRKYFHWVLGDSYVWGYWIAEDTQSLISHESNILKLHKPLRPVSSYATIGTYGDPFSYLYGNTVYGKYYLYGANQHYSRVKFGRTSPINIKIELGHDGTNVLCTHLYIADHDHLNTGKGGSIKIRDNTPASAGATGVKGDICYDSNYIYICIATDTWRRIAHSSW